MHDAELLPDSPAVTGWSDLFSFVEQRFGALALRAIAGMPEVPSLLLLPTPGGIRAMSLGRESPLERITAIVDAEHPAVLGLIAVTQHRGGEQTAVLACVADAYEAHGLQATVEFAGGVASVPQSPQYLPNLRGRFPDAMTTALSARSDARRTNALTREPRNAIEALRARWSHDGGVLRDRVLRAFANARDPGDLVGETERGKRDLRGFPFAQQPRTFTRGQEWIDLDFSYATFESARFVKCRLDDCVFDFAEFDELKIWGSVLRRCSFRGAGLRECVIGAAWKDGTPTTWEHCSLIGANLQHAIVGESAGASFTKCDFSDARIAKSDFYGPFHDCTFAGKMYDIRFWNDAHDPNLMRGCDFSRALFDHVDFNGFDFKLGDVAWPTGEDHIVVDRYRAVLERAIEIASGESLTDRIVRSGFEYDYKWAGPAQDVGCFSRLNLSKRAEAAGRFNEVLSRAIDAAGATVLTP